MPRKHECINPKSDSPRLIQRVSWRMINQSLVELSSAAACSTNKH